MPKEVGVLFVKLPEGATQMLDGLMQRYEITAEQATCAAVAVLVGLLAEHNIEAEKFMEMVRASTHRQIDLFLAGKRTPGVTLTS